ncbi:hypothetical protein BQ1740_1256 [Bacillus subtilis]|nr:hypothetical protein BQ1740_1256 [Bacillus subtilis]
MLILFIVEAIYNLYMTSIYRAKTEKQAKKRHPCEERLTTIPL